MTRLIWTWGIVGIIGAMLPWQSAIADSAQITLYDGPNFTGEQRTFSADVWDLNGSNFNDRAESLIVISGTWKVCADVNYRGSCQTLGTGSYADLNSLGLFNSISSLQPSTTSTIPEIIVYVDPNFGGRSEQFTSSSSSLMSIGINDAISSIQVLGGSWKVCADVNYRGSCQTLGPGSYTDLGALGLQDTISSIELLTGTTPSTPGLTLYENPNFQGASLALTAANGRLDSRGFNDRAASIIISSGTWDVCEDIDYRGRCQRLSSGTYPDLNSFGLLRSISSVRPAD